MRISAMVSMPQPTVQVPGLVHSIKRSFLAELNAVWQLADKRFC